MNTITNAYINALLADAAYVDLVKGVDSDKLTSALNERMTQPQAQFIAISAVNGHSLGDYLATAFTRLFGANVKEVNTFNSAGFSDAAVQANTADSQGVITGQALETLQPYRTTGRCLVTKRLRNSSVTFLVQRGKVCFVSFANSIFNVTTNGVLV